MRRRSPSGQFAHTIASPFRSNTPLPFSPVPLFDRLTIKSHPTATSPTLSSPLPPLAGRAPASHPPKRQLASPR
ncbi:hypothetical protein NL676_005694 [Syzygium grande]|nr:hypothetical protein NL676_005694 [Syzygium grande]